MTKRINKQIAFEQYLKKWGMENYRFVMKYSGLCIYSKECSTFGSLLFEIRSLNTLLKTIKKPSLSVSLVLKSYQTIEFENFDEFKHYTLVEKLGLKHYE